MSMATWMVMPFKCALQWGRGDGGIVRQIPGHPTSPSPSFPRHFSRLPLVHPWPHIRHTWLQIVQLGVLCVCVEPWSLWCDGATPKQAITLERCQLVMRVLQLQELVCHVYEFVILHSKRKCQCYKGWPFWNPSVPCFEGKAGVWIGYNDIMWCDFKIGENSIQSFLSSPSKSQVLVLYKSWGDGDWESCWWQKLFVKARNQRPPQRRIKKSESFYEWAFFKDWCTKTWHFAVAGFCTFWRVTAAITCFWNMNPLTRLAPQRRGGNLPPNILSLRDQHNSAAS